eukprot:m.232478 g.232478  ORF g.232478 m.232478 type:complete len:404 (+) comp12365_c0_seq1:87-1298(+)
MRSPGPSMLSGDSAAVLAEANPVADAAGDTAPGETRAFMGVSVGTTGELKKGAAHSKKSMLLLLLVTIFWGGSVFIPSLQAHIETPVALGKASIIFVFVTGFASAAIVFVAYKYKDLKHISFKVHRFAFMAGATQAIGHSGYTLLIRSGGESSVLAPLAGGLYLVVPVFMGLVFLKEPAPPQKILGIALAIAAILLLSITNDTSADLTSGLTIVYFLMAFFGWGFDVFFMTLMGMTGHHGAVVCMHTVGLLSGMAVLVPVYGDLSLSPFTLGHGLNFIAGAASLIGGVLYYALSQLQKDSSLVAPLTSLYILWPVILGIAVLGDNVSVYLVVGIIVACFAIFLMSITDMRAFLFSMRACCGFPVAVSPSPEPARASRLQMRTTSSTQVIHVREGGREGGSTSV